MITPTQWLKITHYTPLSCRTRKICHRRIKGGFSDATVTFEDLSPEEIREEIKADFDTLLDLGFSIEAGDSQYTIKFTE